MSECELCGNEVDGEHRRCYTCEVADFEHIIGEIASILDKDKLSKRQRAIILREVPVVLDQMD